METRSRTLAKTISWRIMAVIITALITWKVTGNEAIGISVGLWDCFIKLAMFYFHERAWNKITFGYKRIKTDAQPFAALQQGSAVCFNESK